MTSTHDNPHGAPQYVLRSPSLGERLIATFAHLLVLASLPGFIITGIIFVIARGGSPYVRHHARLALRWQLFETLLTIGLVALFVIVIVGAGVMGRTHDQGDALDAAFLAGTGIILVFAIPAAIFAIPAVVGAFRALLAGKFRYPVAMPAATRSH